MPPWKFKDRFGSFIAVPGLVLEIKTGVMHREAMMQGDPDQQNREEKDKNPEISRQDRGIDPQITDAEADDSKTQQVQTNRALHQMVNPLPKHRKELLSLLLIHPPGGSVDQTTIRNQ